MLKRLKLPPPHSMIFPYDIWYIILPHTSLETLLKCRCLCKKVYKICNFVMQTSQKDINWLKVSQKWKTLSEDFIHKFQKKVYWSMISCFQRLSEDFIREFKNKVDWDEISWNQRLSADFIREFKDKVFWTGISCHQRLSEDFIREFKDQVNWRRISCHQRLSEDFIREFKEKVE